MPGMGGGAGGMDMAALQKMMAQMGGGEGVLSRRYAFVPTMPGAAADDEPDSDDDLDDLMICLILRRKRKCISSCKQVIVER